MARIPKYRRHKASGRAVVEHGGRRQYLPGKYGSDESRAAYRKILDDIEAANRLSAAPPNKMTTTLARLLANFLRHAKATYAKDEYLCCRSAVRVTLADQPVVLARDFGPLALKAVRQKMVAKGLSRNYLNHQCERLKRAFKWGVENELIDASVWLNLKAVAGLRKGQTTAPERPKVLPVPWSTVRRVLPYVSRVVATMIRVQWLSGMRSDELTAMRGSQIDQTKEVWIYSPLRHKMDYLDRPKVICLGPLAQKYLAPYMKDGYLFAPSESLAEQKVRRRTNRKTKVYGQRKLLAPKVRQVNERYDTDGYRRAILHGFRAAEKAGVKFERWNPHRLRHARATRIRAVYGVEAAQAQLGNTIQATLIYAETSLALATKIAKDLG